MRTALSASLSHALASAFWTQRSPSSARISCVCRAHAIPGLGNIDSRNRSRTSIGNGFDDASFVSFVSSRGLDSIGYMPRISACADCTVRLVPVDRMRTAAV